MTHSIDDSKSLTDGVGIFVRKLIGQNKKISLVQKRNITRQIENYIRSKINPADELSDAQRNKQRDMQEKIQGVVDRLEIKIGGYGLTGLTTKGSIIDDKNRVGDEKNDFDSLVDKLIDRVDALLISVNNKIKRTVSQLELCAEVLGCRKWGVKDEESHSLHGMIIKLQTDHAAKLANISEERDMLKVYLDEHQINLKNIETENRELAAEIESRASEIERLRQGQYRTDWLEMKVSEVTNQLRESERRCHVLESQLKNQAKPVAKSSPEKQNKAKNYGNITTLYCSKLNAPPLNSQGRKLPDLKAQFLSHLK